MTGLPSSEDIADAVRLIGDAPDVHEAAARLVKLAVEWTGAAWAEVVEAPAGRPFRILAATDIGLATAMYGSRRLTADNPPLPGPRPADDRIVIDDLATDGRWASLTEIARTVPVRAAVLHHLVVEGRYSAGFATYDPRPGYFTAERLQPLQLLAAIAPPLLAGVVDAERVRHLTLALRSGRTIGAAVGVVMQSRGWTPDTAFAELVRRSQQSHRKLRDVASDVVADASTGGHQGRGVPATDGVG